MNVTAAVIPAVVPFSLRDTPSLIEKAWPTAKISAETQKERKAGSGQTLTGLGSYWKVSIRREPRLCGLDGFYFSLPMPRQQFMHA